MIDMETAERARLSAEKARARRLRYEQKHPERKSHHGTQDNHNPYRLRYSQYPFVMWDGEAPKDTGYSLFGSSAGDEICHPHLSTAECFDLLLESKRRHPDTIHVIFGGRYDFDEICQQSMSWTSLAKLKFRGRLTWRGYTIKAVEGKFFDLSKGGVHTRIYETFGWFHSSYLSALSSYQIGTTAERKLIEKEKARRPDFLWKDIERVRKYMHLELKLGPPLMEKIREIVLQAGFNPRDWYGPSALALEALRANKIQDYLPKDIPSAVQLAAQFAYAGGRFEPFRGGILYGLYSYDENSAYMAAALDLPDLAHGNWRYSQHFESGKFAVYHIRYNQPVDARDSIRLYPLFCRHSDGSVNWPNKVDGWYWTPEAELVKDSPYADFVEAWVFDADRPGVCPFDFVREWFRKRLVLENLPVSNPSRRAGKAFKWALASIYGQLARTVGWDIFKRKPPKYHCLEWAGYITSKCRADMYKLAQSAGDKLVSIDTDSVTALCPLEVDEGEQLGQWKAEYYDRGVFFQSGVFALEKDGKWVENKARGIEEDIRARRKPISPEMMMSAIYDGRAIELKPRTRYISVRMALAGQHKTIGMWKTHPGDKFIFGGNGKRFHRASTCYQSENAMCESAESHFFTPRPYFSYRGRKPGEMPQSCLHPLPWKDDTSEIIDKNLLADMLFIDPESLEYVEDKEWLATLI